MEHRLMSLFYLFTWLIPPVLLPWYRSGIHPIIADNKGSPFSLLQGLASLKTASKWKGTYLQ